MIGPTEITTRDTTNDSIIPELTKRRDDMRALVIVPVLKQQGKASATETPQANRSNESRLEEAIGLARAIDLTIVQGMIVPVNQPRPATLLGTGKMAEITALLDEHDAGLVIVDHP